MDGSDDTSTVNQPSMRGRVLATVLFTDIVGSTQRAVQLGDREWSELLRRHHVGVRDELQRFGGREINTAGDGFVAVFDSPEAAVRCAQALHVALSTLGIQIRSGVHFGGLQSEGETITGVALHIGARIAERARPGEVLVSSTVRDLVSGSGLKFHRRGQHHFKGVPEPWKLFALTHDPRGSPDLSSFPRRGPARRYIVLLLGAALILGVGALALMDSRSSEGNERSQPRTPSVRSFTTVAVLPFTNMGTGEDNQYFADGLTEDVITHLSKIKSIRVISRTSVMRYVNLNTDSRDIAKELGVEQLVQGSVQRAEDKVRITAQLVDAATGQHLWAETYDRKMSDIFVIQSDIARQIAAALETSVSPAESELLGRPPTADITAYDQYVRAREHLRRFTSDDNERAIELFGRAIAADPGFALARAGLSQALNWRVVVYDHSEDELGQALEVADQALALDSTLADAHYARGLTLHAVGRSREASFEYERAIELNPSHAAAISELGYSKLYRGELAEALRLANEAVRLDPGFADYRWLVGEVYLWLNDLTNAERWTQQALEFQPSHPYARYNLTWIYLARGDLSLARGIAEEALALEPNQADAHDMGALVAMFGGDLQSSESHLRKAFQLSRRDVELTLPRLAYVYSMTNRTEMADSLLEGRAKQLMQKISSGDEYPLWRYELAAIEAVRGRNTEAYHWLSEGIRMAPGFWLLNNGMPEKDPLWRNLHGDREFHRLLREFTAAVEKQRESLPALVKGPEDG